MNMTMKRATTTKSPTEEGGYRAEGGPPVLSRHNESAGEASHPSALPGSVALLSGYGEVRNQFFPLCASVRFPPVHNRTCDGWNKLLHMRVGVIGVVGVAVRGMGGRGKGTAEQFMRG